VTRAVRFTDLGRLVEAVFAAVAGAALSTALGAALVSLAAGSAWVAGAGWSVVLLAGGSAGTG
jgi:hypothetical protein